MTVDDVGAAGDPRPLQRRGEVGHVREQVVLGQRPRGARVHVGDGDARREGHLGGQVRVVAPGVDDDLGALRGQLERQGGHVDVLAARVGLADAGERAGVLGDQGDAQGRPGAGRDGSCDHPRVRGGRDQVLQGREDVGGADPSPGPPSRQG